MYVKHKFLPIEGKVIMTALDNNGAFAFLLRLASGGFVKVYSEDCNETTIDPS